jgi:YD repeat-containing protein
LVVLLLAALSACTGDDPTPATSPVPPAPAVLLRDIVIPTLPSPYYHFEYDPSGHVVAASFASDLLRYAVLYDGARITEMRTIVLTTGTTLKYFYDDAGRVSSVRYVDPNGVVTTALFLSYDGQKLTSIERDRRVEGGFIIDKTTTLSYYADGNLRELTVHRPAIAGEQDETTTVDRFEQYDDKINVDGFSLIHDEFFDQLFLLPDVRLQKGNPARQTHTGDGVNFTVDYTYTYDDRNRPLTKSGIATLLNGSDAGRTFPTSSVFSYY